MAILIVEDDFFFANRLSEMLADNGVEAIVTRSAEEALATEAPRYDGAIIDVMLPNDSQATGITTEESRGGYLAGVALARRLRKARPELRLALITGDVWNSEAEDWAKAQKIPLFRKYETLRSIVEALRGIGFIQGKRSLKAFIVHGHDEVALLQLKNYLQNVLHWDEPIVLREQPNLGRTIIEKFEDFSSQVDCVFVLLTPDDSVGAKAPNNLRRSRQNVIFELGFFYAHFGRQSGRVIVLHKQPNDLPSDIKGVVWIGIDNGVDAAGEEIRREVAQLVAPIGP